MNVFLIALVIISGCVLQPSIFGGGGVGVGNRLSSCSMFWWRRKEMWAGKTAWRHAALPSVNAWNMQASDDVKIYRYVPPHRVGFLRCFGLKTGKHFAHFSLELGMVLYIGNYGVYERIHRFNSKWVRKKEKYANSKRIWIIFLFAL